MQAWKNLNATTKSFSSSGHFVFFLSSEIEEEVEKAVQIKTIVSTFPRPLLIVMRYLFAFLNQ